MVHSQSQVPGTPGKGLMDMGSGAVFPGQGLRVKITLPLVNETKQYYKYQAKGDHIVTVYLNRKDIQDSVPVEIIVHIKV